MTSISFSIIKNNDCLREKSSHKTLKLLYLLDLSKTPDEPYW